MGYFFALFPSFKHFAKYVYRLMPFIVLLYSASVFSQAEISYQLAFYYGSKPPLEKLKFFKNIVVEPSSGLDPRALQSVTRHVYAYASLGEAISLNQYQKPIKPNWVISKNKNWQSLVLDQSNPEWQVFFLNEVITPLWEKGYRGFFLDTLDSYRIVSEDPKKMKPQQDGMIAIIRSIKAKYPDAKLIFNRGFEIIPEVKPLVDGVVAESLFSGWNNATKKYFSIPEKERNDLIKELNQVKQKGIPVTIIDFLPPKDASQAKVLAKKITDLGFNPWITNNDLTDIYLFDIQALPRKILLLYQGQKGNVDQKIGSKESNFIAMPLNYMGYATHLVNVEDPLPEIDASEYAGIVVGDIPFGRELELIAWYKTILKKKIPLVVLQNFGFSDSPNKFAMFGLKLAVTQNTVESVKVVEQSPMIGFETPPVINKEQFMPLSLIRGKSLLRIRSDQGQIFDIAAITPWGGYYLTDSMLSASIDEGFIWAINPFEFFKQALRLPDRPIPDLTSENGRRLMLVHIDGDGFANKAEWTKGPFAGEVMRTEFLERYPIPTTVSVIQGEIAPNGLYPNLAPILEPIARKIFALPNVEIGTHTYSHPINWHDAEIHRNDKVNPYILPIKGYKFDLRTEIIGSVEYINKQLAPKGKKCMAVLWSGEGDISEEALGYTYQLGISNINPGKLLTQATPSISHVSAVGIHEGPYFQVFAPTGNDDETIAKDKLYYSLIKIINAFKLTDKPRRLKAMDIYIHFYSVSQLGGIKALNKVYQWALSHPVMNIYVSDYFYKTHDFNDLSIVKKDDGWLFVTSDFLRELRIPKSMGFPDLINSSNIIGYNDYNDDRYIHMGPGGQAFVRLTNQAATLPYLQDASSRVSRFVRHEKGIDFSLDGYLPPKFTLANVGNCTLWEGNNKVEPKLQQQGIKSYEFEKGTQHDLSIRCE